MLTNSMQQALNKQVQMEAELPTHDILGRNSAWLTGRSPIFYQQSDEKRTHMLKPLRFINKRGGFGLTPALAQSIVTFKSIKNTFDQFLKHELKVSSGIND